jgi:hypothetical protein
VDIVDYDYGLYDVIRRPEENGGKMERVVAVIMLRNDHRIWYLDRDVMVNKPDRWWVRKELEFVKNSQVYSKMFGHVCAIFKGNKKLPTKKAGRFRLRNIGDDEIVFYSDGTIEIARTDRAKKPPFRIHPDIFRAESSRASAIRWYRKKFPGRSLNDFPQDEADKISRNIGLFNSLQYEKKLIEGEFTNARTEIKSMISEQDAKGIKVRLDSLLSRASFNPYREQVKDAVRLIDYYLKKALENDKPMILEMVMATLQKKQ